VRSDSILFSMF